MDIETELLNVIKNKPGNQEAAILIDDGDYNFLLGNESQVVEICEGLPEYSVRGQSLTEVIEKMKKQINQDNAHADH